MKRAQRAARRIGVTTDADYDERRMIIVREAARAFAERGVGETSVDEIARRVGVTKAALYHYIPGKDQIIAEVLRFGERRLKRILRGAASISGTGLDRLRFIVRELGGYAVDEFTRCTAAIDPNSLPMEAREASRRTQAQFVKDVAAVIDEGMADGSIRRADSRIMTFVILGTILNLTRWYRQDGTLSIAAVTEQLLQLLETGVRAP